MEQNKQTASNETEAKKNDNFAEAKKTEREENKHIVKLSKSYKFEDEGEISEIDLSGLEDATADVLMKATRVFNTNGEVMVLPENDIRYALFVASECTEPTYDFYKKLNMQDAIKVKREVMSFFNGTE